MKIKKGARRSKNIIDTRFAPIPVGPSLHDKVREREFYPIPSTNAEELMSDEEGRYWGLVDLVENPDFMESLGIGNLTEQIPAISLREEAKRLDLPKRFQTRPFLEEFDY